MPTGSTSRTWRFLQRRWNGKRLIDGPSPRLNAEHSWNQARAWQLFSREPLTLLAGAKHDELPVNTAQPHEHGDESTIAQSPFIDRRSLPRKHVMLQGEVTWAALSSLVRMIDISSRGTAIASDELPSVGSYLKLTHRSQKVHARVAWQAQGRTGLEFRVPMDPAAFLRTIEQRGSPSPRPHFRRAPLGGQFMSKLDRIQNEQPPLGWNVNAEISGPNRFLETIHGPEDRSECGRLGQLESKDARRERIWRLSHDINHGLLSRAERQQRFD